ncbi:MAG: alanine racemase [bacterium]
MNKYELDTPVAIVDLDIMEKNINDMASFAKNIGVQLRPHIKTHKVPEIADLQLSAGASGITCAKLGEAEVMLDAIAVDNIFIANQLVGENKIQRLFKLLRNILINHLSVAVDSIDVARPISDMAVQKRTKVPVLIKIDVGLKRTGVPYGEPTVRLAKQLDKMPGLELVGIYTHEGHVYGSKNPEQLKEISLESGRMMVETADMLRKSGFNIQIVSVGSTPSAKITCTVPGITEIRPGTYVFNDYYQIRLGVAEEKDCAFSVLSTVISTPERGRAVIDAGTKSITSEKCSDFGVYGLIKNMPHVKLVRAYEEHGVLEIDTSKGSLKVGDKVEIIPNHVCPAVNLFDELIGIRKDLVETTWKVSARGKLT